MRLTDAISVSQSEHKISSKMYHKSSNNRNNLVRANQFMNGLMLVRSANELPTLSKKNHRSRSAIVVGAKGASRIELRCKIKLKLKPNDRELQALCSLYHCSLLCAILNCVRMMNAIVIYTNE